MATVFLRPGRLARLLRGHPWIYDNEIDHIVGEPEAGDLVEVRDPKKRPFGYGLFHPTSKIAVRRLGWGPAPELDTAFFQERIARAWALRSREVGDRRACCRVVSSEADLLPGLTIDRYGERFVIQITSFGMERRLPRILESLEALFQPRTVWLRNDASVRTLEGLERVSWLAKGDEADLLFSLEVRGTWMEVDLKEGHKGGLYLDQLDNQQLVGKRCTGQRVLDCFSYQGGFALAAARNGAKSVTAVEISEPMSERIKRNAVRNGTSVEVVCSNAFDYLRAADGGYDLVVLDPPSFTKSKAGGEGALRGYKEIHLRALKLLGPGGRLATFSCSHHIDRATFEGVVVDAAADARRVVRRLETYGQPLDHPVLPAIPETEYLKGALYEVVDA